MSAVVGVVSRLVVPGVTCPKFRREWGASDPGGAGCTLRNCTSTLLCGIVSLRICCRLLPLSINQSMTNYPFLTGTFHARLTEQTDNSNSQHSNDDMAF